MQVDPPDLVVTLRFSRPNPAQAGRPGAPEGVPLKWVWIVVTMTRLSPGQRLERCLPGGAVPEKRKVGSSTLPLTTSCGLVLVL